MQSACQGGQSQKSNKMGLGREKGSSITAATGVTKKLFNVDDKRVAMVPYPPVRHMAIHAILTLKKARVLRKLSRIEIDLTDPWTLYFKGTNILQRG